MQPDPGPRIVCLSRTSSYPSPRPPGKMTVTSNSTGRPSHGVALFAFGGEYAQLVMIELFPRLRGKWIDA